MTLILLSNLFPIGFISVVCCIIVYAFHDVETLFLCYDTFYETVFSHFYGNIQIYMAMFHLPSLCAYMAQCSTLQKHQS